MKVAFQMEPMEDVDKEKSATLLMMVEAQKRGYELYHYISDTMSASDKEITADIASIGLNPDKENFYTLGKRTRQNLENMDIIMMRQNPPVDMRYLTLCYMLEALKERGVFISNDPTALINIPEKMSLFKFSEYMPPTLVTQNESEALNFFKNHKNVVIKPLYLFSGHDIKHVQNGNDLKAMMKDINEPIMIQKFLPEITQGNKRIILFNGEIIAAIRSIPVEGDFLVYREGEDLEYTPSDKERQLCEKIGRYTKKLGAHFVGVDLIGDYLTEINTVSVGSLYRTNKTKITALREKFWNMVERQYSEFKKTRRSTLNDHQTPYAHKH